MKKILLSVFSAALALAVSAQQNSEIAGQWGKLIDGETTAGDQSTEVCVDNSGNVYWFGTYGSTDDALDIKYDGEFLYSGAAYTGTSQNNNFTVLKTDANGNKLWCVYSNSGDFENNAGGCAVTTDGGIVVVSKVRHTDGYQDKDIQLVDANGTPVVIEWKEESGSSRIYRMLVTKISSTGTIEWNQLIEFSSEPGPKASGNYASCWSNVFNLPGSCAVDENNNIYIPLNYRNPLTIAKADNSTVTLTPKNNQTWTGDPQSATGDFLILKLDNNGYYSNSLELDGTASAAYCQKLAYDNGKIYAQGYITGNGTTLKAGEYTLAPSTVMSPVVLCADANLGVQWAKCYPAEQVAGKNALQNVGITVCNGTLWLCGQYNLKFTDPDNTANSVASTQGSIREAFILKLDAANGEWIAARNSRDDDWNYPSTLAKTGLTGYFKVLQNAENPEKIYVFGYVMNAAVGVVLREYDATTLEANLTDGQNNIVTQGGMPSCQAIAYDAKNCCAYLTARGMNGTAFNMMGGLTSSTYTKWGILAAKFKLPATMAGIDGISADSVNDTDAPVEYFNLQGIRIANPTSGNIYIRRQGSNVSKIIME